MNVVLRRNRNWNIVSKITQTHRIFRACMTAALLALSSGAHADVLFSGQSASDITATSATLSVGVVYIPMPTFYIPPPPEPQIPIPIPPPPSRNISFNYTGSSTPAQAVLSNWSGVVSASISGLTCNTTYHFSPATDDPVAIGAIDSTFTTAACPTPAPAPAPAPVPASVSTPTVSGPITGQTITTVLTVKTEDVQAHGSIFVAAVLPSSLGGGVYFMSSSGGWSPYTSCNSAPAYYTGVLPTSLPIPLPPTDLSSLIGTQLYVGYGGAGPLTPAGTACTNMLNNGTYLLAYTVQ